MRKTYGRFYLALYHHKGMRDYFSFHFYACNLLGLSVSCATFEVNIGVVIHKV